MQQPAWYVVIRCPSGSELRRTSTDRFKMEKYLMENAQVGSDTKAALRRRRGLQAYKSYETSTWHFVCQLTSAQEGVGHGSQLRIPNPRGRSTACLPNSTDVRRAGPEQISVPHVPKPMESTCRTVRSIRIPNARCGDDCVCTSRSLLPGARR